MSSRAINYFDYFNANLEQIRQCEWNVLFEFLDTYGSAKGRLLEVGCRDDKCLRLLNRAGWDGCGLDINPSKLSDDGLIKQGDVVRMPFNDDEFDVVFVSNAFYAFPDRQLACKEIYRVLKPRGLVVLLTANGVMALIRLLSQYLFDSPRLIKKMIIMREWQFWKQALLPKALTPPCRSVWSELYECRTKRWVKYIERYFVVEQVIPTCFFSMPDYRLFIRPVKVGRLSSSDIIVAGKR